MKVISKENLIILMPLISDHNSYALGVLNERKDLYCGKED